MQPDEQPTDNELIFISIASYRDSQLVPTVIDLLAKADEPALLRFGVCWQHGSEENYLPFAEDVRFRVIDIDWRQSRGACWARAEVMKLYQGEQYFMQVDSHCRFVQGWDTKLIRMMSETRSPRPILSTYANAFTPSGTAIAIPEVLEGPPHLMALEGFAYDGIPQIKPLEIRDWLKRPRPMAARFLAAGFLFTLGSFVQDVPYDPDLYFFGEEISMTLRAYTSGYDLFHPVETIVWHDYIRTDATRHWKDHDPTEFVATDATPALGDLDGPSREKVKSILTLNNPNPLKKFGLGPVRTLEDYEAYTGISFLRRKMQDPTRLALEPPNPPAAADWPDHVYTWLVKIMLDTATLSPCAFDPTGFWMTTILDEERREIRRHDFSKPELKQFSPDDPQIVLVCEIQSGIVPAIWSVWPFSRERAWGERLEGRFAEDDFSIIRDDVEEAPASSAPSPAE